MASHPLTGTNGPGSTATCEGCGTEFARRWTGQKYCTARCYRLTSDWAYGTVFNPANRKAPPYQGSR